MSKSLTIIIDVDYLEQIKAERDEAIASGELENDHQTKPTS